LRQRPEISPADADLDAASALIEAARDIVIFLGFGAHPAKNEISQLSRRLNAPIVHTYRALDLYVFDVPQVIGGLGACGAQGLRVT
jgi:pyruvate dehydrogenase (quinone)/pyruvate oxidase